MQERKTTYSVKVQIIIRMTVYYNFFERLIFPLAISSLLFKERYISQDTKTLEEYSNS